MNRSGLFCVKFEKGKIIIPLWEIEILAITISEGHYNFHFKFINLINHIENNELTDYSSLFKQTDKLAEYVNVNILNNLNREQNDRIWTDIIEKIGETTYSNLNFFKSTFFYRLLEIRRRKRKISFSKEPTYSYQILNPEKLDDFKYGYQLRPKADYEISIFHKIPLNSNTESLREYYNINLSGPFRQNLCKLNTEINSHYSTHQFSLRTINEKYVGNSITFSCNDNMSYLNKNNPTVFHEIFFRRVKIPILLEYSGKSVFFNKRVPSIGLIIGSIFLILGVIFVYPTLSVIGSILQTISILYLPKRE